jgi:hypothetical protein
VSSTTPISSLSFVSQSQIVPAIVVPSAPFARLARVEVRILHPGESLELG